MDPHRRARRGLLIPGKRRSRKETMKTKHEFSFKNLPPFWYAVGGFFAVPLTVLILTVFSVVMLAAWPFIPFWFYWDRKREVEIAERVVRKEERR